MGSCKVVVKAYVKGKQIVLQVSFRQLILFKLVLVCLIGVTACDLYFDPKPSNLPFDNEGNFDEVQFLSMIEGKYKSDVWQKELYLELRRDKTFTQTFGDQYSITGTYKIHPGYNTKMDNDIGISETKNWKRTRIIFDQLFDDRLDDEGRDSCPSKGQGKVVKNQGYSFYSWSERKDGTTYVEIEVYPIDCPEYLTKEF